MTPSLNTWVNIQPQVKNAESQGQNQWCVALSCNVAFVFQGMCKSS